MKESSVAVATKQASEATDTAFYSLPVDPGGNSEQAREVGALQPFVVHDGGEMPVSLVPPTVVVFRETFSGNVGCDDKSRGVEALPARSPEPQEEFVILCSDLALDCLDVWRKETDSAEHGPTEGRIGREQAQALRRSDVEGRIAVVYEREGSPVLSSEPRRQGQVPAWEHSAADTVYLRMLVKRTLECCDPVWRDYNIVIGKGDDWGLRAEDSGVAAIGDSLPRFEEVT